MPIGKNAIKRVTSIKSEAPEIKEAPKTEEIKAEKPAPKAEPKKAAPKASPKPANSAPKQAPAKKPTPKKEAPKKSMESEPSFSPVIVAQRVTENKATKKAREGEGYINLGGELPYYLL